MKPLTKFSARVLSILIDALEVGQDRTFDNAPGSYMPVVVERIAPDMFSVAHYGRQNGDAMRDPEIVFYRSGEGFFFAVYFRNDYVGVEQESITFDAAGKPERIHPRMQRDHASFASTWMANIREQQLVGRAA